uniref:Uncharacterized protein n=1 Tax=Peronospora matthiolae TaxID=2874970 RepID=A0AAV1URN2_9STRA
MTTKGVTNAAVSTHQVLEKRKHDQAFGTAAVQEQLSDKDTSDCKGASHSMMTQTHWQLQVWKIIRCNGRMVNAKKTLDIVDDDDEDAEWQRGIGVLSQVFTKWNSARVSVERDGLGGECAAFGACMVSSKADALTIGVYDNGHCFRSQTMVGSETEGTIDLFETKTHMAGKCGKLGDTKVS